MTKEELIGRKFKDNLESKYKDIVYTINRFNIGDFAILSWWSPGEGAIVNHTSLFKLADINNYINLGRFTLIEEEPKMYKTNKGIEYGVGTSWTINNVEGYYTITEVIDKYIKYTYSLSNKGLPITIGKKFFEDQLDNSWQIYKPTMKDYKQVDPKTITFDFTNTKIKVNNEDESKWIYETALVNSIKPIYGNPANIHNRNEGWYFNKNYTEHTSANFEEYGQDLREITIQDILNNMKEVIEVGDTVIYPTDICKDDKHIVKELGYGGKDLDTKVTFELGSWEYKDHVKLFSKGKKKEIIGYETVVDLPGIPKGSKSNSYNKPFYGFAHTTTSYLTPNVTFHEDVVQDTKFFKPIYKQDIIELKFSKYTATLSKENGLVFTDGEKVSYTELQTLLKAIRSVKVAVNPIGTYKVELGMDIKSIKVGCKSFTTEDVKLISEAIKKLE